jgi:hypothetical protein
VSATDLPLVNVDSPIADVYDLVLKSLAMRAPIFQRSGRLVHIMREPMLDASGVTQPIGQPRIEALPDVWLEHYLEMCCVWHKEEKGDDGVVRRPLAKGPPKALVQRIFATGEWAHIDHIHGIVQWPVMRTDGSICSTNGYDAESGYHLSSVPEIALADEPTIDDAKAAAAKLLGVIADFPIETDAMRAAWLSGILTLVARPAIAGPVPALLFDAATPGSGKTLLAQLLSVIVTGEKPPVQMAPSDASEWTRTLGALAKSGHPMVLIDNVKGKFEPSALEAAITSGQVIERKLRSNDTLKHAFTVLVAVTANNAQISTDLVRRSLHVRLVAESERPELRGGFAITDVAGYCQARRGELLGAALTILQAYVAAGRPGHGGAALGAFEQWDALVRGALCWVGCGDPVETQAGLRETASTEESGVYLELLEAWAAFTQGALTVAELIKELENYAGSHPAAARLRNALAELCECEPGECPEVKQITARLKHVRGRVFGGIQLQGKPGAGGKFRWRCASNQLLDGQTNSKPTLE